MCGRYILEESPLLHVFVCLAWLEHFREQLLAAATDSVHDVVVCACVCALF